MMLTCFLIPLSLSASAALSPVDKPPIFSPPRCSITSCPGLVSQSLGQDDWELDPGTGKSGLGRPRSEASRFWLKGERGEARAWVRQESCRHAPGVTPPRPERDSDCQEPVRKGRQTRLHPVLRCAGRLSVRPRRLQNCHQNPQWDPDRNADFWASPGTLIQSVRMGLRNLYFDKNALSSSPRFQCRGPRAPCLSAFLGRDDHLVLF